MLKRVVGLWHETRFIEKLGGLEVRKILLEANRQKTTGKKLGQIAKVRPSMLVKPSLPKNSEPRTGLSMGEHCELMAKEWAIPREEQDQLTLASHKNMAAAYERGYFADMITPFKGLSRDNNLRADSTVEKLAKLTPVFGTGEAATMTAGNSTPLSDGASAVLLAGEEWAAERGLPVENLWSTERYLASVPALFARVRQEVGHDVHLLHDVHHRLTPIEAARLGKELEPHHLFWLEDAVPAELQEGFRLIRQHTTTPLAVGEVFSGIHECRQLIQEQLIDYIRCAVVHAGGISHLRKIAHLAELFHVRTGCHGATDLSPVTMAAALHFDLSVHNFGIQEYMRHNEETDQVFPHAYGFADGFMHPGEAPGLGVDIDETLAARYPYQRAYLPVNRKEDGTMHSW